MVPAFRYALIEYAKPYKTSYGTTGPPFTLDDEYVPSEYRNLHARLMDARDQIHAHSDLTVKEARLHVENTENGKIAGMGQNKITGAEELPNIEVIIDLIEKTLDQLNVKREQLEQQLPPTS